MAKERLFYLDFVRALAAIAIVITHYNAVFLYWDPPVPGLYVIDAFVFGIYIGNFGVSLFLIISGAALMHVYGNGLKLKKFYIKRFKSLYPMFWIAYSVAFLYMYVYKGNWATTQVPKQNLILTFLGMDGYLADIIPTFYLVGEWFLGFIVIFYIVFPVLRFLIEKKPVLLAIGAVVIYCALVWISGRYTMHMDPSKNLFVRLPELLFGMYFIKYIKKVNLPVAGISLAVLIVNQIIKPSWNEYVQTTYIGIAAFLVLVYISQYVKSEKVHAVCAWISKYSYAIFLTHHIIIYTLVTGFNVLEMSHSESYLIFFGLCFVIAVTSVILYKVHDYIMKGIAVLYGKVNPSGNDMIKS